jgi:phosphatidylserine/phosphatidylglycerophosphate/cardiolipin synthase-like enzyme
MSLPVSVLDALSSLAGELPSSSIADLVRALEMSHAATVRTADLNLSGSVPPAQHASVRQLVEAWQLHSPSVSGSLLAAALVSMGFYDTRLRRELQVEAVWTGPRVGAAGLRRTEQVLLEMIATARASIWLVAFAAYKVPQVSIALQAAIERGVRLRLVLEDRDISEGKVTFDPLTALAAAGLARAEIFVWPVDQRPRDGRGRHGTLHAKGLVVDDRMVFITSANMTEDALNINMELGVALHVPAAARQIADHLRGLVSQGILVTREA